MGSLETVQFGRVEYDANQVYSFPGGLPGFENFQRFLVLERPDLAPLVFLQSLDSGALRFICVPVRKIAPGYRAGLSEIDREILGWNGSDLSDAGSEDLRILAILTFAEGAVPTANLRAPVILNDVRRTGTQAIQADAVYSCCQPLARPQEEALTCS